MISTNRYCAKLIHGWGGCLGSLAQSESADTAALMSLLDTISLDDVRDKVDSLLLKQYHKRDPVVKTEQELLCSFESTMELVIRLQKSRSDVDGFVSLLLEHMTYIKQVLSELPVSLVSYLSSIPSRSSKIRNLSSRISLALEDLDDSSDVKTQSAVVDSGFLNSFWEIDSDEEAKLLEDIDVLMDTQERAEAFRGNTQKFLANSVQCTFRRIFELEHAFQLVNQLCLLGDLNHNSLTAY